MHPKTINSSQVLITPIILLEHPEKKDIKPIQYIDHMYHNSLGSSILGKFVIKILRFNSGAPEEWIIFMDLVQMVLGGQNVTTGSPMYQKDIFHIWFKFE